MPGDLAEEPIGVRLIAAPGVGTGEIEEAAGEEACVLHTAYEQQSIAQLDEHKGMVVKSAPSSHVLQRLIQEWAGLHSSPGQGIRCSQGGGEQRDVQPDVGALAER
jgi:hypothetical protein